MGELQKIEKTDLKEVESIFNDISLFGDAFRIAKVLTNSTMVPKQYQGENNIGNTLIAMDMSKRMDASLMFVMQNLYVVNGNPSWASQFIIAQVNNSNKFKKDLRFEYVGREGQDSWGCYAWTIDNDGDKVIGSTVTMSLAKSEGWYNKNGSKWKTMPGQMLMYRAATFFARVYAPEVLMGIKTEDEVIDMTDQLTIIEDTDQKLEDKIENEANKQELVIEEIDPEEIKKENSDSKITEEEQQSMMDNVPF